MLITFVDGQLHQVLSGIKDAELPYETFYKFNNSSLYVSNKMVTNDNENDEELHEHFDECFWKMGQISFDTFLKDLDSSPSNDLVLTKDVIDQTRNLEVVINNLHTTIKGGISKLEDLKTNYKMLKEHQASMDRNMNYSHTVCEEITETEPTKPGQYKSNFLNCNVTCHEDCPYNKDGEKKIVK